MVATKSVSQFVGCRPSYFVHSFSDQRAEKGYLILLLFACMAVWLQDIPVWWLQEENKGRVGGVKVV
jgi:hypothetical protein